MKIVNSMNIPLATAVWLADDTYDYQPNTVSTTTLMKPLRQIILAKRADKLEREIDIVDLVSSSMGSAIHDSIERVWLDPFRRSNAMRKLGYSEEDIKRVVINPEKVSEGDYPVYIENRMAKEVEGYTITGKYDMVMNGQLNDHKSTSTFMYTSDKNIPKYVLQGSIYRWLDPKLITKDTIQINFFFTDWSKLEAIRNIDYPQQRAFSIHYPLKSIEETEKYVLDKIQTIMLHEDTPDEDLPLCTSEDLWRDAPVFKYYSDPSVTDSSKRSTRTFDTQVEATAHMLAKGGVGVILTVEGKAKACNYCNAKNICSQKAMLVATGQLKEKS